MRSAQIDRLLAGVPPHVDERHRRRVQGYAAAARRCDERIIALRIELERALWAVGETELAGHPVERADEAIRLVRELDGLERAQPRIDSWLRNAVGALSEDRGLEPFGEGPV